MADPGKPEGQAQSVVVARVRMIGWSRVIPSLIAGCIFAWLAWRAPVTMPGAGPVLRYLFGAASVLQLAAAAMMVWRLRQRPEADS